MPQAAPARPRPDFAASPRSMLSYLPLSLLVTASVLLLPAAFARLVLQPVDVLLTLAAGVLAGVLSITIARLEAWAWQRRSGAADVLFSDLMLWGFARRCWVERRLRRMRSCYELAAAEGAVRLELLEGLNRLLESRSAFTYRHCRRVARHAERTARALHLPPAEVARIRSAALVHDIGKLYTPFAILHKPGPLTDAEYATIKLHAADGADMLSPVRDAQLARVVRHHHERVDGSGYPDRLAGEQIPIGARIVAVADTFDAITSARPYRRARSQHAGLAVLAAESGRQLDAKVVDAFLTGYSGRRSIAPLAIGAALLERVAAVLLPAELGVGSSAAQLLPALGAAGILAAAPAAPAQQSVRHEPSPIVQSSLRAPFAATLGRGAVGALGAPQLAGGRSTPTGTPRARTAPRRTTRALPVTDRSGRSAPQLAAPRPASSTSSTGQGSATEVQTPLGDVKVKVPGVPVTPPRGGGRPPSEEPPVTTPPVTVPPVTTPPVSTPPVSTPPVTVPSVPLPIGTTPRVEVPSVHLPKVEVPTVKLPGLKAP